MNVRTRSEGGLVELHGQNAIRERITGDDLDILMLRHVHNVSAAANLPFRAYGRNRSACPPLVGLSSVPVAAWRTS